MELENYYKIKNQETGEIKLFMTNSSAQLYCIQENKKSGNNWRVI